MEFGVGDQVVTSRPVFDASYTRGAVMSTSRELVFFDPFFGGVVQRVPFSSDCSTTLITDSAHATVFVLDTGSTGPGRIRAIDFATGYESASFDLPNPVVTWCEGSPGIEVYIAEGDLAGQYAVRHVSLEPFADLGSAVVGTSLEDWGFENMIYAAGQVFASTTEWLNPPPHFWWSGCLTRCRFRGPTIQTRVEDWHPWYTGPLTPVLEANRLLASWHREDGPGGGLVQMPLTKAGAIEEVPPPYGGYYPRVMNADGKSVWAICQDEENGYSSLYRLDLETMTWISYPLPQRFSPWAAELLRDAWDHEYWVANVPTMSHWTIWPEIHIVDELLSTTRQLRLDRGAIGLFAVPLP